MHYFIFVAKKNEDLTVINFNAKMVKVVSSINISKLYRNEYKIYGLEKKHIFSSDVLNVFCNIYYIVGNF